MFKYTSLWLLMLWASISYGQDTTNHCLKNRAFHIVVLGSSTAVGIGPTIAENAWVNRYRTYLQSINPSNQVTNLGASAKTTYNIMPTGYVPPADRPGSSSAKNISQAIALKADAVIVNMPSNDTYSGYSFQEQMFNFKTVAQAAADAGIPIWICTMQPRTPFTASQNEIHLAVRDEINSYFGLKAIDFWTTIANSNNDIDPLYNSGDGIHLNDIAHAILFERVRNKNILSYLLPCNNVPLISSFTPKTGTAATDVIITGSNFTGTTSVMFNVTEAPFTINSATQITARVPQGATSGKITVTTAEGTVKSDTDFQIDATPVISWDTPASITYGTSLSALQLNAQANVPGSYNYTPGIGTILAAGTHTLKVDFVPDDINYQNNSKSVEIIIGKATPVVSWNKPSPSTYGTALSAIQLNATSNIAGTFTYSPAMGTVLNVGNNQALTVSFKPADELNYVTVNGITVTIDILPVESCSATGSILREYWANIPGEAVSAIPLNKTPSTVSEISLFETASKQGDNYAQRVRGYICVPQTGNYTFYIAADNNAELWLSPDDKPTYKTRIASITGTGAWAAPRTWTSMPPRNLL